MSYLPDSYKVRSGPGVSGVRIQLAGASVLTHVEDPAKGGKTFCKSEQK